ncbi:hypothetical protein ND16A_2712 [Thalassotalea sp. ND16A]|nr:hypothetical protein ND16A_2712 [Thalassotalea sp. ND16A]
MDTLKVASFALADLQVSSHSSHLGWRALFNLRQLSAAINQAPYFALIKGAGTRDVDPKASDLYKLVSQLNNINDTPARKLSVTRVAINQSAATVNDSVTRYSRQPGALKLHTDSSYMANPHPVLAFQCVVADPNGGETILMAIDDIIAGISDTNKALLSAEVFPFAKTKSAILAKDDYGAWNIRFYKTQLEQSLENEALEQKYLNAISELEASIANEKHHFRTTMQPGDMILVNNLKALHGRSNIEAESPRVIYRIRSSASLHQLMSKSAWQIMTYWLSQFVKDKAKSPILLAPPPQLSTAQLVTSGKLAEALECFASLPNNSKEKDEQQFLIAAVARYLGDDVVADKMLEQAIKQQPISCNSRLADNYPRFIKIRGFNGAQWIVNKHEKFSPRLKGGHFSLKFMFNAEKAKLYQHNILDAEQAQAQAQTIKKLGINLIINTIACADRMAVDLTVLDKFQQLTPEIPVINPPEKVLLTTREQNYQRLNDIANVVFPKTVKVLLEQQARAQVLATMSAAKVEFPIIMRPCITHTGAGVELIDNSEALQLYLDKHQHRASAFYIIQYYQLANTTGVFNKIRTFCIDGKYYPVACIFDNQWNIHSGDRYNYMANCAESQQTEQSYFADMTTFLGDKAIKALERIREIIELDFFGVDFTLLPDGKILIFECNAAMRHNFDHVQNFPYTYQPLRNVSLAFEQMLHQRAR